MSHNKNFELVSKRGKLSKLVQGYLALSPHPQNVQQAAGYEE